MIKSNTKKSKMNFLPLILIGIVLLLGGLTIYNVFSLEINNLFTKKQKGIKKDKTLNLEPTKKENNNSSVKTTQNSTYYDALPFYPNITEMSRYLTKGDGVQASYETETGVTAKQVLDFYEKELKNQNWQITLRDKNDGQIQALSIEEVQLRIWIYFDGSSDQGVVYNVDFRPPGAEEWLPIPIQ